MVMIKKWSFPNDGLIARRVVMKMLLPPAIEDTCDLSPHSKRKME